MIFFIKKITNNGYRCCCHQSWEDTEKTDDRTEALSKISKKHHRESKLGLGFEIEKIEITDGTTGEVIAEGTLNWVGGRGSRYVNYHWFGHIDGKPFDDLYGLRDGESIWTDIVERVTAEEIEQRKKKLEIEIFNKSKELEELKNQLK